MKVVVIGGGCNGLAAAAQLAAAGHRVTVVEQAPGLGGHRRTVEFAPGFFTSPGVFDTGFVTRDVAALVDGASGCSMVQPATDFVIATPGDTVAPFAVSSAPRAANAELRRYAPQEAEKWLTFVQEMQHFSAVLSDLASRPAPRIDMSEFKEFWPLLQLGVGLRRKGRRSVAELLRNLPLPVHDLVNDWFAWGPLAAAVAAGGVMSTSHGPRAGGTTLGLLHNMMCDGTSGVRTRPWLAGGPDALVTALADLCRSLKVDLRTSAPVSTIGINGYKVESVVLNSGEVISCDAVISTADPRTTICDLIPSEWLDPELRHDVSRIRMRGCTGYVSIALRTLPESLNSLHADGKLTAVISGTANVDAVERSADAIKYGTVAERPLVELLVASARWPHLAPSGQHVLVARVHHLPLAAGPQDVRTVAMHAVETMLPGTVERAIDDWVLTPADIEERYAVSEGALHHGEVALDQFLFMRGTPELARHTSPIVGLYLGGSGVHPGPGVPGGAGTLSAAVLLKG